MPDEMARQSRAVEELVSSVMKEAQDLRQDVIAYEAAHRRERRAYRFMGAAMLAAILVCVILIATVRQGASQTRDVVELIRSCTTPTGECYRANQANTGDFRDRLQQVVAVITDCEVGTEVRSEFRKCVKDRTGIASSGTSNPVPKPLERSTGAGG